MRRQPKINLFAPLHEAGLSPSLVANAVLEGERRGRDQTTALHPRGYGGTRAYAETVQALRVLLIPSGWKSMDVVNQARVVSNDERFSIIVMSGDARTGMKGDPQPRARHPKGDVTKRSTADNAEQLWLLEPEYQVTAGPQTWVLLTYRELGQNGAPDSVRFEVSLPVQFIDGNVRSWAHREIFPPIDLDTPPSLFGGGPDGDGGGENDDVIEIPVKRR